MKEYLRILKVFSKKSKIGKLELNYIILAHKNPRQIKRLICNLEGPGTYFYIHVDACKSIAPFKKEIRGLERINFIEDSKRKRIIWGDIGMVHATLGAMQQILKDKRKGYCVLLSGQDYPLQNSKAIHSFFEKNENMHFLSLFKIPHPNWEEGGLQRLKKYKINKSSQRKHFLMLPSIYDSQFYSSESLGKLNFLRKSGKLRDSLQIFKKRTFPRYLEPYGGGQWWAFPMKTVKKILKFNEAHPDYLKYHKYTLIPDEIFFHSILMHLEDEKIPNIAKSLTYVNWERSSGPLPVTFKSGDIEELKKASIDHLFARKFDIEKNEKILNEIDKKLLN